MFLFCVFLFQFIMSHSSLPLSPFIITFFPLAFSYSSSLSPFPTIPFLSSPNNPQQIQENWNHIKHLLGSQWLETRNKPREKNPQKHSNIWRLNDRLLNNEWVTNEIKEIIKNYLETNENKHTTTQNLLDTVKAILRGKFIAIQVYLKKIKKSSNKQPNSTSRRTRGTTTNKAKSKQIE